MIILFFHAEVIQPPGGRRMIRAPAIMRQKYIVPSAMMRLATYAALPIFGASHDPNRERRLTFEGTTARAQLSRTVDAEPALAPENCS